MDARASWPGDSSPGFEIFAREIDCGRIQSRSRDKISIGIVWWRSIRVLQWIRWTGSIPCTKRKETDPNLSSNRKEPAIGGSVPMNPDHVPVSTGSKSGRNRWVRNVPGEKLSVCFRHENRCDDALKQTARDQVQRRNRACLEEVPRGKYILGETAKRCTRTGKRGSWHLRRIAQQGFLSWNFQLSIPELRERMIQKVTGTRGTLIGDGVVGLWPCPCKWMVKTVSERTMPATVIVQRIGWVMRTFPKASQP